MRGVDAEPLLSAIATEKLGPAVQALQLHEAERWRLELVNTDDAMARWSNAYPGSNAQRLRALVLAARRESALPAGQRHGRAWRELFQFVKLNMARS